MEITANALQTVLLNQNVQFTDVVTCGNQSIFHRAGSGLIAIRGITNGQCRARFRISFGGNIAIPTGGTVEPISIALAVDGEAIATTSMISTPAAAEEFNNVFASIYLDVPRGCCYTISVKNTSTQSIDIQNANLIVDRVA